MKTITISTPVRNREFVLPYYLTRLYNLNYDKKLIDIHFIVNNSEDSSFEILKEFQYKYKSEYNRIKVINYLEDYVVQDNRKTIQRANPEIGIYQHLAKMRNKMLSLAKTDYLFSIDSDILILDFDILNKLLSHNKDIVSSLIFNGYVEYPDNYKKYTNCLIKKDEKNFKHISENKGLIKCNLTGAIYLLSKEVYQNVKYGYTIFGEDNYFCEQAEKQGYKMYCDTSIYSQHIMSQEWLNKFMKGVKID